MGEALHQVAQARDALDVKVKGGFIDPLQDLQDSELKEIRVRSVLQPQLQLHPLLTFFWVVLFGSAVPAEEGEQSAVGL